MKRLIALRGVVFFSLLIAGSASAQSGPRLGSADSLLEQARQGPSELVDAVLILEDNLINIGSREVFQPYFDLLNDFEELFYAYGLQSIHPRLITSLGNRLALHGNRWVRVGTDSEELVMSYQMWTDEHTAWRFQTQVESEVRGISGINQLMQAARNLQSLLSLAKEKFPNALHIRTNYEMILSEMSLYALLSEGIESEGAELWLSGLVWESALREYLFELSIRVFDGTIREEEIALWLNHFSDIGEHMSTIHRLPTGVRASYGALVADLFDYMISNEIEFEDIDLFTNLIHQMPLSSLRDLIDRWVNPMRHYSDEYAVALTVPTLVLLRKARESRLFQAENQLKLFSSVYITPAVAVQGELEGHYRVRDSSGKIWYFTFLRQGNSGLIGALSDEPQISTFGYFLIEFDPESGDFFAIENYQDYNNYLAPAMRITFDYRGGVELELPSSLGSIRYLVGNRIESYTDYLGDWTASQNEEISGEYRGIIRIAGRDHAYQLSVTDLNGQKYGRLVSDDNVILIPFPVGTDGQNGVIYLTSGKNLKGSWHHLRLRLQGSALVGDLISGGMGRVGTVRMHKIQ